jgi:hypothetical protein
MNRVSAQEWLGETPKGMAKKKGAPTAFTVPEQTGADLRAWRLAVGLLAREVAELIGVSERTVLRAERSAKPYGKVLVGFKRLQDRLAPPHGVIVVLGKAARELCMSLASHRATMIRADGEEITSVTLIREAEAAAEAAARQLEREMEAEGA